MIKRLRPLFFMTIYYQHIIDDIMKLLQRLQSPTPKLWRQIGNALLSISTLITGYTAFINEPALAITSMVCGVLGKIITSFFVEEVNQE